MGPTTTASFSPQATPGTLGPSPMTSPGALSLAQFSPMQRAGVRAGGERGSHLFQTVLRRLSARRPDHRQLSVAPAHCGRRGAQLGLPSPHALPAGGSQDDVLLTERKSFFHSFKVRLVSGVR